MYSNGNKNNSVYQYYRNMIPQNMQYPSSGTVTAGPVSQPPPIKPNDIMTNTSTANGGVAAPAHSMQQKKNQAVIEIDDDDNGGGGAQVVQQPSSMPNGDQLINGTDQLPVIPS